MRVAIFNHTALTDCHRGSHFGCALVMSNLVRLLREQGLHPMWYSSVRNDWREKPDLVPRDIHGVIVNGEGSIHDSLERWKPRALAAVGRFAQQTLQVPSILLNATICEMTIMSMRTFAASMRFLCARRHPPKN